MVKNGCDQFGDMNIKLTVFEERANEINWFFAC